jgi:hypothetical protein
MVHLDPSHRFARTIEGEHQTSNLAELAGKEKMEQKVEEAAAKKFKARTREGEVKGQ